MRDASICPPGLVQAFVRFNEPRTNESTLNIDSRSETKERDQIIYGKTILRRRENVIKALINDKESESG